MNSAQLLECSMIVALAQISADRANEAANRFALSILPIADLHKHLIQTASNATKTFGELSAATFKLYVDFVSGSESEAKLCMEYDVQSQMRIVNGLDF